MSEDFAYNWDDENAEAIQREQEEAATRKAQAYHHVFAQDPLGNKILQEWITQFCTGSPPSKDASEREVGMMDGKRELVKMIIDQITRAGEQ